MRFSREQLFVVILVLIVTAALWALFRFARFGLATRAAAENEKGAVVLGFSPDFLAGSNWVLSTMLAALFGMVAASADSSVDPVTITLLVIPALSAVLVGNLSSFWITALAAFLISMAKPVILFSSTKSWYPVLGHHPDARASASSCRSSSSCSCCSCAVTRCRHAGRSSRGGSRSRRRRAG